MEPGQSLLINPHRDYASLLSEELCHTFCVSYGPRLLAEARLSAEASPQEALDSNSEELAVPVVLERVYAQDSGFDDFLQSLLQAVSAL